MKLSRKSYIAIAEIIKGEFNFVNNTPGHCYNCKEIIRRIADELSDYFVSETDNFDEDKFKKYIGIQ